MNLAIEKMNIDMNISSDNISINNFFSKLRRNF